MVNPINYFPAGNYLLGNEQLEKEILSSKYHSIDSTFLFPAMKDLSSIKFIICIKLSPEAFFDMYTYFPAAYILILIISFGSFFLIRYFIKQIKKNETLLSKHRQDLMISNQAKDKFFSIIAHDLKNPITAMSNISSIFADYYSSMSFEEATKHINLLGRSTASLANLLDNLVR